MIENLLQDPEAVIRQHIAGQLLQLSIVAMMDRDDNHGSSSTTTTAGSSNNHRRKVQEYMDHPEWPKRYDPSGYKVVCKYVVRYLNEFLTDSEVDVRRAASDSLAGLALQLESHDVEKYILPIPLRLAQERPNQGDGGGGGKKRSEAEQRMEELRTTACNLLAEMGGAASEHAELRQQSQGWVREKVLPAILELCQDDSFRVRRSAAQALPRVMGSCTIQDAEEQILPIFETMSQDEIHRVRKSTGECLVDMSRALMMLVSNEEEKQQLLTLRRKVLLPIADRLIQDPHKQVRQGMMQFLGPFMASFYPYQSSTLHTLLPTSVESDGSHHLGIVAQFFPHASSMVARLNSSQNAIGTTPAPVHSSLDPFITKKHTDMERLQKYLPSFLHASRMSALSLKAVTHDRQMNPPDPADISALVEILLDYFAALSVVNTGDENTDAEMRVYCAYSFPALVLLLGAENWEGSMRTCFFTLLNPAYGQEEENEGSPSADPPLPVKRCLASSLHTVAHVLGPELAARDIVPAVREHFLKDPDDSVRLNMMRNFSFLLAILPTDRREEPFLSWSEIVLGESFLGGRKRSATNPVVLNWRQRNYLARSLVDIIGLVPPQLLRNHVWPILQILLLESINDVREDALWSVSVLLRAYCVDTVERWGSVSDPKKFSNDASNEVVDWIVNNILISPTAKRSANFNDRQLYCEICGSVGLALRLSEESIIGGDDFRQNDPVMKLTEKFRAFFSENNPDENKAMNHGAYQRLTTAEYNHLKKILTSELLPAALEMKDDRISNVRITLMKVLQIQPRDVRISTQVKPVLRALEDENATWTSFGDDMLISDMDEDRDFSIAKGSGPVDVDDVTITPAGSRDEDDVAAEEDAPTRKATDGDGSSSDDDEGNDVGGKSAESLKSGLAGSLRTVIFDDGPIGMQLEPTRNDEACRVYGFNDFGPGHLSPAQSSGLIFIGDIIVSVNGVAVHSYDETIDLLKAGGRREVTFRDGTNDELYNSEGHLDIPDEQHEEHQAEEREELEDEKLKEKKSKKEAKKVKKKKKDKEDGEADSDEDSQDSKKAKKKKKDKSPEERVVIELGEHIEIGGEDTKKHKKKEKKEKKGDDGSVSGEEESDEDSKKPKKPKKHKKEKKEKKEKKK